MLAIRIIHTGRNGAILFAVFDGVLNQVEQNLSYFFFIGKNG